MQVGWPVGVPEEPLTLATSIAQDAVTSGAADVAIFDEGPQLAVVLDAQDRPALFGFVSPDRAYVDARTTAEVLMYFGLGVSLRPTPQRLQALEAIRSSTQTDALAGFVEDALAHDRDQLFSPTGTVAARRARIIADLQNTGVRISAMIIEPAETQSGVTVLQPGFEKLEIMNAYRRRATAYVTREWYEPKDSTDRVTSHAEVARVPIVPVAGATSVIGTLVNSLLLGNHAFAPTVSEPISVPRFPADADATGYEVLVVGMGAEAGPAWEDLTLEQTIDYDLVVGETLIFDMIIPILADLVLPVAGDDFDRMAGFSNANSVYQDGINLVTRYVPGAISQAASGDLGGAVRDLFTSIGTSGTFRLAVAHLAFEHLVKKASSSVQDTFLDVVQKLAAPITVVDASLTAGDVAMQIAQIAISRTTERWEVVVTGSKLALSPPRAELLVGQTRTFEAVVHDASLSADERDRIEYTWYGGGVAGSVSSDGKTADFRATREGTDTIRLSASLDGVDLGEASGVVRVLPVSAYIVPRKISLFPRQQVELTAKMRDTSTAAEYRYTWHADGTLGMLFGSVDGTPVPTKTVRWGSTSDDIGTEFVSVKIETLQPDGSRVFVGAARAQILVEHHKTVMLGRFDLEVTIDNVNGSHGSRAFVVIPKVDDAISYSVYGYNFYDWAYYGYEYSNYFQCNQNLPRNWYDWGDEYAIGLTSGGGSCTPPCEPPYELMDWQRRRFAGIVVESTVRYP